MTAGWIKLHRQMTEWEWYNDANTIRLFLHLLLTANHDDNRWQGVMVRRGQRIAGRHTLSEELGISERSIRTSLKRLKSTSEVTIKATNRFSVITVNNYEKYQSKELSDQPSVQPRANKRPASDHKQEGEEGKEIKKVAPRDKVVPMTLDRPTQEKKFKQLLVEQQWCDQPYADKTWDQGCSMSDRDEFFRKVALLLAWAIVPSRLGKAKLLFHEIAGFVNDRGAMRQHLTTAAQAERDEFAEQE